MIEHRLGRPGGRRGQQVDGEPVSFSRALKSPRHCAQDGLTAPLVSREDCAPEELIPFWLLYDVHEHGER